MLTLVLIATPTPGFGELIQQTLEDTNLYQAVLVNNSTEAIERAQANHFSLCILDFELNDIPMPELVRVLLKISPHVRLIAIPPDNDPADPSLAGLPVQDILTKPFYLPDLITKVSLALSLQNDEEEHPRPQKVAPSLQVVKGREIPVWLQDVTRAAQYLTSLSLESSALAALIVRDGQLWAYAGQLPQEAAQELAGNVVGYMETEQNYSKKSDLARFTSLEATNTEYMLYATSLGGKMVLALVFDTETPFNKIRTQASQLAKALASSPPPSAKHEETFLQAARGNSSANPSFFLRQDDAGDEFEDIPLPPVKPLLDDVPLPKPVSAPSNSETTGDSLDRHAASPKPIQISTPILPFRSEIKDKPDQLASEGRGSLSPVHIQSDVSQVPDSDPLEETRPHVFTQPEDSGKMKLKPVSPAVCDLSYACVLVPRIPRHRLIGDVEGFLSEWIPQLCMAYGWRLVSLSINPTHIEWVAYVSPFTSPGNFIRILRQHTSARIFSEFPSLANENPSGDFWAPGYLIMSSSQPPPMTIVQEFIQQTRLHQGAYKSDR